VTHPVVGGTFGLVGEDFVSLPERLELLRRAVVVVNVWMILSGFLPPRLLDVFLGGVRGDLEEVVEVVHSRRFRDTKPLGLNVPASDRSRR
jgi:hypothetical protein